MQERSAAKLPEGGEMVSQEENCCRAAPWPIGLPAHTCCTFLVHIIVSWLIYEACDVQRCSGS